MRVIRGAGNASGRSMQVLKQLDADGVPQIRVYNKIDKLDRQPRL